MLEKHNLDYFAARPWSFVLIKNDKIIYKSKLRGLKPLILCIKKNKTEMQGAIVYDKIIGKAAAILLACAKVKEVWTSAISFSAKQYLARKGVKIAYIKLIKYIKDRRSDGICPMEEISQKMPERKFIEMILKR